ncbi:MAG: TIGR04084 family radical SAM/SPASM domain-containing protein [Candidatus Woesearchaeota archaeon]
MFFHIILTTRCNLQCKYCYGASCDDFVAELPSNIDISYPEDMKYDVSLLKSFCDKDKDCVLTFYGGEPLCNIPKLTAVMDQIMPKWYMMQTNAMMLDKLPSKYVNRFHTILTSIDGDEKTTDNYRGVGVYKTVLKNIALIKKNGYTGELIARMAVMEDTEIYSAVTHLVEKCGYTSVHWQLDAMFWENDLRKRNFVDWVNSSYNHGIKKLIAYWLADMKKNKRVLKLYPFLDIMHDLLHNQKSLLRCGSGHSNYTIQTDGTIIPCPIMLGMKDYYLGHIRDADPAKLKKVHCNAPCDKCKSLGECGGRCLYANVMKPWGPQGYEILCPTVHNLIDSLKSALPEVKQLISSGVVKLSDFDLVKFNGCEIIP